MATSVSAVSSDNMMDALNTDLGTNPILRLYNVSDAQVAEMAYTGTGVVSGTTTVVLTYAHANFTDETNADITSTVTYATLETSAGTERVRFSAPTTDIGLSSTAITAGDAVDVNVDIVVQMPAST